MPLPFALSGAALAPIALRAAPLIAAAAIGAVAASRRGPTRLDMRSEEALDAVPDGSDVRIDPRAGRADAEARWRRVVRFGRDGPGFEVDAAMLARFAFRRVPSASKG